MNLKLIHLARLSHQVPKIWLLPSPLPQHMELDTHPAFTWTLGIQTQVVKLSQQALYWEPYKKALEQGGCIPPRASP